MNILNRIMKVFAGLFLFYTEVFVGWPLLKISWNDAVNYPTYHYIDVGSEHFMWFVLGLVLIVNLILLSFGCVSFLSGLFNIESEETEKEGVKQHEL